MTDNKLFAWIVFGVILTIFGPVLLLAIKAYFLILFAR